MAYLHFKQLTAAAADINEDQLTIFDIPNLSQVSEELPPPRVLLKPKVYPTRKVLEPLIMTSLTPKGEVQRHPP